MLVQDLRTFERLATIVLRLLPGAYQERTRDCIQITYNDEQGVVILLNPDAMEIRLPSIDWVHGVYGPVASSRLWRRILLSKLPPFDDPTAHTVLNRVLQEGLARRRQAFRQCRFCHQSYPPERMHARRVCQGCAERNLGVVH